LIGFVFFLLILKKGFKMKSHSGKMKLVCVFFILKKKKLKVKLKLI